MRKRVYNELYIVKAFAIISVICAHCNAIGENSGIIALKLSILLQNIGTIGVGCFFVVSGILFSYKEGNVAFFFRVRVKRIVVPWIFSATMVYLYVYLRKPPLGVQSWLNFVIGNGSYCYYLSMLILLYLIYGFLPFMSTNVALVVCECVTAISIVAFPQIGEFSPYLNILNWIGYFAFGMQIMSHKEKAKTVFQYCRKWRALIYVAFVMILAYQICSGHSGGYWKGMNVILCWLGGTTVFLVSISVNKNKQSIMQRGLVSVGKKSFFIYLWHMPIAGITARVMLDGMLANLMLIRPVLVLGVMLFSYNILGWGLKALRLEECRPLLGMGD